MAVFKCKMCGGNLEAVEGQNIGTCDSCGSTMTLPKANDERVLNLFNRATHYRQQNEFDKAIATYESILEEDNENAEAYWGLVLSKYGIEYVEDPKTHKRIPTCHRLQHESILSDLDYKSALKYALDYDAEKLYTNEAEKIAEIQKNILSVADSEEAYDIFICYKETDNSGKRTMDSVLAQDIYSQLVNEGYKVFFSRITLEDKLGQEYEPYIFSALNSSKVMLVVGTKKDNFNAVWVKNEWSRFLALSRKDKNKVIIPCYKDMDAYDLPDELSMFQSQDMNKIGFLQDLIRGIKKILNNKNEPPKTTVFQPIQSVRDYKAESESMLKRAFMFLEEAEWTKANDLLEKVLNIEPENVKAYIGKLMIEVSVNREQNLANRAIDFSNSSNYKKALRFADNELKQRLEEYNTSSLNKFKQMEKELREKNEKKQAFQNYIINVVKANKTEYKKFLCIQFAIFFVFAIVAIIIGAKVLNYGDSTFDVGFFSIFLLALTAVIIVPMLLFSTPNFKAYIKTTLDNEKEFEIELNKKVEKSKKKSKMVTAIGVTIAIILSMVSGNTISKISTVKARFSSVDYITTMLKNNPSVEKIKSDSKNLFSMDNVGAGYISNNRDIYDISGYLKFEKCGRVLDESYTLILFDKQNNVIGCAMKLADIFNSMTIDYNGPRTETDLKNKLGNFERKEYGDGYLIFKINGCNAYIRELNTSIDDTYDGYDYAFIMKP